MADLEKRISGDWIDMKDKAGDLYGLMELLPIGPAEMRDLATRLRLSVEGGIVECKRSLLMPVFTALEGARFKSLDQEEIQEQEKVLTLLVFAVLAQRLSALEALPGRTRVVEEKGAEFPVGEMNMNTILSDVKKRVAANPALRTHAAIKNILGQVQIYKGETAKMNELKASIKPEKQTAFMANFNNAFGSALASIRRNYAVLLKEEDDALREEHRKALFSWRSLPLKDLAPFLLAEAREVARLRSSLAHARDEKWKTREILVGVYDGRHEMIVLVEKEPVEYGKLCAAGAKVDSGRCVQETMRGFTEELIALCERHARREEPLSARP